MGFVIVVIIIGIIAFGIAWLRNGPRTRTRNDMFDSNGKIRFATYEEGKEIHARFDNNTLVKQVYNDAMEDGYTTFFDVRRDGITTKNRKYTYKEYGLQNLSASDCRKLAICLADWYDFSKYNYRISELKKIHGSVGETFYYETPGGYLASKDTSRFSEELDGFRVEPLFKDANNKSKPWEKQLAKW